MYNQTNTAAASANTTQQQTRTTTTVMTNTQHTADKKETQEKTAPIEKKKTAKVKAGAIFETLCELPENDKSVNVKISAKVYAELEKVKELYNGHLDKQQLINYLLLQHANIFGV